MASRKAEERRGSASDKKLKKREQTNLLSVKVVNVKHASLPWRLKIRELNVRYAKGGIMLHVLISPIMNAKFWQPTSWGQFTGTVRHVM